MVDEPLTDEMIESGANLLRALDKVNISIRAALWLFINDTGRWRLFVASPEVRDLGPKKIYSKIAAILKRGAGFASLGLDQVAVIDTRDPLVQSFVGMVGTGMGIGAIRIRNSSFNGIHIGDALIYRQAIHRS
jgi:hypothetical protein